MALFVKNWERFQHFKDRKPPWIKLYRDLLDDKIWHELDAESAKVLVSLWLIASEDANKKGELPPIQTLAFRLRVTEKSLKSSVPKLSHWLRQDDISVISDNTVISPGYHLDSTETETETETDIIPKKDGRKTNKTPLPENWIPAEATVTRLTEQYKFRNGDAQKYLDSFRDTCKARAYTYADFDAAFSNAVRKDWPGLRNGAPTMPKNADPHRPNWS